ncbi:AraC-like DNA-binding protein [Paenibacillus phyllosphaerae]|uniref:AraC-like DNA-binding protein n=1 Tax=Paenibacillus phyllosphaerae TaxID=274593 RepID=A0A7W5FKD2_9BACL|nr:AraC family transcriptional regulator [Paenibacillus phyllosphaerae]MBB3107996.1 AraC-like DNA-binding protein [Paenibacillus phyllosphaerae]
MAQQASSIHALGDITVKAGSVLEMRSISDFELVYFPSGTNTRYQNARGLFLLNTPGFVFTCPGEPHEYRFDPHVPTRHLFIHFESPFFREAMRSQTGAAALPADWKPLEGACLVPTLMKQLLMLVHAKPERWRMRADAILACVIEEWMALGKAADDSGQQLPVPLQLAVDYMEQQLGRQVNIEEIAAKSGWTHEHFTRVFTRTFGISPQQSLIERRLRRAEQLLIREEWTIKRVALEVGFTDEHYFSRMFKRSRGLSATEFRKRFADPKYRHLSVVDDVEGPYPKNRHFVVLDPMSD